MKSTIKKLSITSLTLLITACSSTSNNESDTYGKGYGEQLKGQQLYAFLSKGESDRYAFTSFTTNRPSSDTNLPWVDLNQLIPVFPTYPTECATGNTIDGHRHEICSDLDLRARIFHDSTIDTGDVIKKYSRKRVTHSNDLWLSRYRFLHG